MALLLGVDTGGTYTDAALIRDDKDVVASAKSLTTRHDLAEGIGNAIQAVLDESGVDVAEIGMASLSTTLATNALVEGQGERVALVYVGFNERDLDSHGLNGALAGDPVLVTRGGHDHSGAEQEPLDENAILAWLETDLGVSAFAVASQFATRNPQHELQVSALLSRVTGKPVSCSHDLSAKLNGPKRAVTAVLNARLIGMIARLIQKAEEQLVHLGINAPLMVVRGDGALISARQAKERPIETILSGPAASIVGARWLTNEHNALVSDIGGTTTDVALLRDGRPSIDPAGAQVGPWRTMVEAVAMRTTGLGGDSEITVLDEGLTGGVFLGPKRVVPVSLMAQSAPDIVHRVLDEQLRRDAPSEQDARFVVAFAGMSTEGLPPRDRSLLDRIGHQVQPLESVLKSRLEGSALKRLVNRGLVQIAGATPSDASHVTGQLSAWDGEAAEKTMALLARKRKGNGDVLSETPKDMAELVIAQLVEQTVLALLETAFAEEGSEFENRPADLARHELMHKGMASHRNLVALNAGLNLPVIGLGASAPTYYPPVGVRLQCPMILPTHTGVANAIGAVVGRVTVRKSGTITAPSDGIFRVHKDTSPEDFPDQEQALTALQSWLEEAAKHDAHFAGAEDIQLQASRKIKKATVDAKDIFVEAEITVEASGRPRIAI